MMNGSGFCGCDADCTRTHLYFQELLQADHVRLLCILQRLPLGLENESWWESVSVLTQLPVGTLPKPSEPEKKGSI